MLFLVRLVLLSTCNTRINAVKELRQVSGAGLKDAVEMLEAGIVARADTLVQAVDIFTSAMMAAGFKKDGYRIEVVSGYTPARQPYILPQKSTW